MDKQPLDFDKQPAPETTSRADSQSPVNRLLSDREELQRQSREWLRDHQLPPGVKLPTSRPNIRPAVPRGRGRGR
jgi:hypothetical protein